MMYKPEIIEMLGRTKQLLDTESKWTQGSYSRDIDGESIDDANSKDAVCWCMYGALNKINHQYEYKQIIFFDAQHWLTENMCVPHWFESHTHHKIMNFNDLETTTYADIMELFDKTIESLKD